MITINDQDPWKYLGLLSKCISILLVIGCGALSGKCGLLDAKTFVPTSVKFVFNIALPLLVINGLGIQIDLYEDTYIWEYIGAFLILRGIALLISFAIVFVQSKMGDDTKTVGHIAVIWLSMTWMSTIILGLPIMQGLFQDECTLPVASKLGKTYGILAGVSSFLLQLPLQLVFLEFHSLQTSLSTAPNSHADDVESNKAEDETPEQNPSQEQQQQQAHTGIGQDAIASLQNREIWKKVIYQMFRNPVLRGICMGFLLTLSTVGPTYLNSSNKEHFVPGLAWFEDITSWMGGLVSPISLFTMGLWMQSQGRELVKIGPVIMTISMVIKCILVPLVMLGLARAFDMSNITGRAAILIASLPISMASFSLASRYEIGETFLSANVAVGTIMVLPTIIVWNIILDEAGVYPIDGECVAK